MQLTQAPTRRGADRPLVVMPGSREFGMSEEALARPLVRMLGLSQVGEGLGEHSREVGSLAAAVGRRLRLPEVTLRRLRLAGVLHDLGKVFVPKRILDKPGPLSSDEWEQVRRHPETGFLFARSAGLDEIAGWIRAHHERPDGRGYPFGLKSRPLGAAIIATADAFQAMTADRPYRRSVSPSDARREMERCAGTQFEPQVVEALLGSSTPRLLDGLGRCSSGPTRT
jgi:HD-GYP domain-containing protein (c-di-GMP phosphodiesterase class II)